MKTFHRRLLFSLVAGVCALALLGMEGFSLQSLKATGETSYSCADITFGTNEYSSSGEPTVGSFSTNNFTVTSVVPASSYCPSTNVSGSLNDSARIGKLSTAGSLTFNFHAIRISKIKVLAYEFGSDASAIKTAVCQVSTSAQTTVSSQSVTATTAPDISDSSTDPGLVFTNLDNGGSVSTWLTIASTDVARFNLCKIVITITSGASVSSSSDVTSSSTPSSIASSGNGDYAPITFNFIEQGNQYTGDCTYIKAGDNDILIDAGNRTSCATTIETYLEDSSRTGNYVSDGKLEYVIATHAHQDHIAGFVGVSDSSSAGMNGILYRYSVGTLIDFSRTNATSAIYGNYQTARTYAVNQGAKHFTALQCWNNEGGASRSYDLGQGLSMQILYNYYYENSSVDENNYSVCVLFTQGSKHFLMTGDLEADGESRLVSDNALPEVELFKGGHHGSYTANTDALLSVIKPKLVCICACVGNTEYTMVNAHSFPAQESIDRIAPYTDRVYCTTLGSSGSDTSTYHVPMNGSIRVHYDAFSNESLSFTNNDAKLKDTAWFKANRTCPSVWSS